MLSSIASALTGATTTAPAPRPDDGPAAGARPSSPRSSSRIDQSSGSQSSATGPTCTLNLAAAATTTTPPPVAVKQAIGKDVVTLAKPEPHHSRPAEPHHPPSHPTPGLARPESTSAAAASRAHAAPPKLPSASKPDPSSAASAAACLAHAGREAGGLRNSPSPSPSPSGSGGSARNPNESWPLRGARGAMGLRRANRRRSGSSPANLGAGDGNAFDPHAECDSGSAAGSRQKSDVLNAATVSMANERLKREEAQPPPNRLYDTGQSPPTGARRRRMYPHLEEAARLRAEERLARLGYGSDGIGRGGAGRARSVSLDSCHPSLQGRSTWELDGDAERRKSGQDALLLMSTARRNVQACMDEQDRRIAESRFMRADWLSKATGIARRQADQRRADSAGVPLGGGAYMTQEELYRVAERNVRPVIDDINQRAGEHHQLRRIRDMQRRTDEGDKKLFGSRRQPVVANGLSPLFLCPLQTDLLAGEGRRSAARDTEEQAGDAGPGEAPPRELGRHDGADGGAEVYAVPEPVTGGQSTLLDRIAGKSRAPGSLGPFNHIGMVRGRVAPKTRIERSAALAADADDAAQPGAPVPGSPVDADGKQHPSSGRGGLLGLLKRPFGQKPQLQAPDQGALPAHLASGSPSRKPSTADRQTVGSLFDRIRGSRAGALERSATGEMANGHAEPRDDLPMQDPTPEANTAAQPTPTTADARCIAEEDNVSSVAREDVEGAGVPELVFQSTVTETLTIEKTTLPSFTHGASLGASGDANGLADSASTTMAQPSVGNVVPRTLRDREVMFCSVLLNSPTSAVASERGTTPGADIEEGGEDVMEEEEEEEEEEEDSAAMRESKFHEEL